MISLKITELLDKKFKNQWKNCGASERSCLHITIHLWVTLTTFGEIRRQRGEEQTDSKNWRCEWKQTPGPLELSVSPSQLNESSAWAGYCVFEGLHNVCTATVECCVVPLCRTVPIFFFNFYWRIVDLQCCVSFCYTAKWVSYTDTCIHSFLDSFPI